MLNTVAINYCVYYWEIEEVILSHQEDIFKLFYIQIAEYYISIKIIYFAFNTRTCLWFVQINKIQVIIQYVCIYVSSISFYLFVCS
jgi:hypothetical protein